MTPSIRKSSPTCGSRSQADAMELAELQGKEKNLRAELRKYIQACRGPSGRQPRLPHAGDGVTAATCRYPGDGVGSPTLRRELKQSQPSNWNATIQAHDKLTQIQTVLSRPHIPLSQKKSVKCFLPAGTGRSHHVIRQRSSSGNYRLRGHCLFPRPRGFEQRVIGYLSWRATIMLKSPVLVVEEVIRLRIKTLTQLRYISQQDKVTKANSVSCQLREPNTTETTQGGGVQQVQRVHRLGLHRMPCEKPERAQFCRLLWFISEPKPPFRKTKYEV
ncbi:unnamed protein product [Timema podura]|uniref:Uncharacterized protein n=1 Tax=Timema podura TaxID=61482 RepID=A0ABN7NVR0_TIMPD|nr:unnamed protein product [Timema podura]